MLFKSPRGTRDILPQEIGFWIKAEEGARKIFKLFGYEEIRTPILEEAKLFSRSLGDLTDIVQKQMFLIKRETDTFVLRPEGTAPIVRAYVENTLYNFNNVSKFFYMGPMFRAERPQKGRLRQFHHIGCEAIGSGHPHLDAETAALAVTLLKDLGIQGWQLVVNSLGCSADKKNLSLMMKGALSPKLKFFCEDCQERMGRNIFRVLDCKNSQCREIVAGLGLGWSYLCSECERHFDDVGAALESLNVEFVKDPLLVRGLDYYTRTVFELIHPGLGAQNAIGAGGRYDLLVEELGGPARGAVGFALGVERLMLASGFDAASVLQEELDCYLVALGDKASKKVLESSFQLRQSGLSCDLDFFTGSLKSALRRADKKRAVFCVVIGDNELEKGAALVKDMRQSTQEEVPLSDLAFYLCARRERT